MSQSVYQQIAEALRDDIRAGDYRPGDRFPTERQIAERYQVSRPTANKALASLVAEGLLIVRTGAGTFVASPTLDYDLRNLVSFTAKARAGGGAPSSKVLHFETCRADALAEPDCCQLLALPGHAEIHAIERLRLIDGQAVIHERRWVRADCCPELSEADLVGSLYSAWEQRFGLQVLGADQSIKAIALSAEEAALLDCHAGEAALEVRCTGWIEGSRRLWYEQTIYRGDAYEFRGSLGQTPPGGHGQGHIGPSIG